MSQLSPLHITFAIYILGMIGIGFAAWFYTRSFDDYILGGRSLGPFVTAMSAGASDMSGWLLLGLPGALYASGLSEGWIAIGLVIGAWCNWKYVAAPLRAYTERTRNALTLPDYFTHRFEDRSKVLRVLSAVVILVFFAIYSASGIVAGARLFEAVFAVPYAQALWVGAAATIHNELLALRARGCAIVLISEELEELFALCDRIAVCAAHALDAAVPVRGLSVEAVGQRMAGPAVHEAE